MQLYTDDTPRYAKNAEPVGVLASGSRDQINDLWSRAKRAANEINAGNFDYKGHDPAYEFGGNGGEIQNSNSVAFTLIRAMGLDPDKVVRDAGVERRFSGWGRDLLDPNYRPRDLEAGCTDCLSCHTTIREWALGTVWIPAPVEVLKCVDYGEVLVHAEIGPKSSVKAMTYWKTSPEVREDMKRLRHEDR